MAGHRVPRHLPWMGGLVLLAALFTGLLAMHGLQSTPSPSAGSGLAGVHISHDVRHSPGDAMADSSPAAGFDADVFATGGGPAGGIPMHQHPGGQVCLGLLVVTWLLLLLVGACGRDRYVAEVVRTVRTPRRDTGRRPSSSIFQLSVLRL